MVGVEWTISCAREKVRDLLSGFDDEEIPYRLVSTRESQSRLLTPRQRFVFDTAMKEGYDVPRKALTLTRSMIVLDVAKSTLSAQLHRIESSVHHAFADEVRKTQPLTCSYEHVRKGNKISSTLRGQPTEYMGRLDCKLQRMARPSQI